MSARTWTSTRLGDALAEVAAVAHVAAHEDLTRADEPSLTGPTSIVMPYSVTILRAMPVAFSMSFEAPVVGSWKMISSATRPPMA